MLLVTSWPDHRFERGVARFAKEAGWHLSLDGIYNMGLPHGWRGDGCLAQCSREDTTRFVKSLNIPVINLYLNPEREEFPGIGEDNRAVGIMGAEYFLERGFHNFAVYRPDNNFTAQERMAGFAETVQAAGHQVADLLWDPGKAGADTEWVERKAYLTRVLGEQAKPLAVFCIDDMAGLHIIEVCRDIGLDMPYQVAVLGVGDMPVAGDCSAVPLSSVRIDTESVAYRAAAMLNELMEGRELEERHVLVPPTGIVERRSTSTIAVQHPAGQVAVRFMLENYTLPIGPREIAAAGGLTRSQWTYICKEELGKGPAALLEDVRMKSVLRMLKETDFTVARVALESGLGTALRLLRIFQRRLGTSPGAWRKQQREAEST